MDSQRSPSSNPDSLYASLWADSRSDRPEAEPLESSVEAETIIVGAGYTGLSAALTLAAAGQTVVVLEANEPGWGGSGRNTGWWVPFWLAKTPEMLVNEHGPARGRRIAEMMSNAALQIPETVRDLNIDCNIKKTGVLVSAACGKTFDRLRKDAEEWNRFGGNVESLGKDEIQSMVASNRYVGAINYLDGGMLDPLAFTRGLAKAANADGVRIFNSTPACSLEESGSRWRVGTPRGEVRGKSVIIATNAFTGALWPGLDKTYFSLKLAMIATEPFPDHGRSIIPGGVPFVDGDAVESFGAGFDREGRLVMSMPPGFSNGISPKALIRPYWRMFRRVFPQAPAQMNVSHVWYGDLCVPPDMFPKVYNPAPGIVAVLGYTGNGITQAMALGREAARFVISGSSESCALPPSQIKPIRFQKLANVVIRRMLLPLFRRFVYRFG